MKIGIDTKNYASHQGGIFNATFAPLTGLIKSKRDWDFLAIGPEAGCRWFTGQPNVQSCLVELPAIKYGGYLYNFTRFPYRLPKGLDGFYSPYYDLWLPKDLPQVITIHDLVYFLQPEGYNPLLLAYYKRIAYRNGALAKAVITVSESSRRDILTHLGLPEDKVVVIPNSIDPQWLSPVQKTGWGEAVAARFKDQALLLYPGGLERRKNLGRLLEAVALLPEGYCLVLTGNPAQYRKAHPRLVHLEKKGRAWLPGFLSSQELRELYGLSQAVVYPSLLEGFGYPMIEAMATRKPLACSNASCLPEIGGDYPIYFDPKSPAQMAEAMLEAAGKTIHPNFVFPEKYRLEHNQPQFIQLFERIFGL